MVNAAFWQGRRVLVTGHTGFKGAYLSAWLVRLGAVVSGYSLPPDETQPLFAALDLPLAGERFGDVNDAAGLASFVREVRPAVVFHMAAQALVRPSYAEPVATFATNLMGTVNLLEAIRGTPSVRAAVVVTTDKVYENSETGRPFRETDPLGGHDPYSASKACAEIATASYRRSFFSRPGQARIATVRSGNVVGGGDWSPERLVPDLARAVRSGEPVQLRYPGSVRPWLHVLDALAGYLVLAERLVDDPDADLDCLNLAPDAAGKRTVAELVDRFSAAFGGRPGWVRAPGDHPKEAGLLLLDAGAARRVLGWQPRLSFDETIAWTADWYRDVLAGADPRATTSDQIDRYRERVEGAAGQRRHAAVEDLVS